MLGEQLAANFLISQDYTILNHNYHCRFGEIDLITIDQTAKKLVFVEVKTRISKNFGIPAEALTQQKQNKIIKTIFHFFESSHCKNYSGWRIDLIGLELDKQFKVKNITHLKNILN